MAFVPLEAVWPGHRLDVSRRRRRSDVETGYTRFREGDILIPKITPTFEADRSVIARGLVNAVAAGTTELHVLRCGPDLDVRFANYVVSSRQFLQRGTAELVGVAGQKRVPGAFIENFTVRLPALAQQRVIADFLDAETSRIDSLVRWRKSMAELLDTRLSMAITALVLSGSVSGRVATAPGTFLPEPPLGWRSTQLRHVGCDVQTGPFGSQLHAGEYVSDGWPVVNPMHLSRGVINADPMVSVTSEKREALTRHILRVGDIVFARRGEMGRAAVVCEGEAGWLCGTGSLRLRLLNSRMLPAYLSLLIGTSHLRAYFSLASVGSTMDNLNESVVLGTPVMVPPIAEQGRVVDDVAKLAVRIGAVVEALSQQTSMLREHRQALITAAVAGEIDVTRKAS